MLGETLAAQFLARQGVTVLHKNYRCRLGEIDLIGRDGDYLIMVEVKTRFRSGCGLAAEAVDRRKQAKICAAFRFYCMEYKISEDHPVRFDVIEVDGSRRCRWIRNAFEMVY